MDVDLIVRRRGSSIIPDTNDSLEAFKKLPADRPFTIRAHTHRNPEQLKLYWVMAGLVAENCPDFADKEEADWWVRLQIQWMLKEHEAIVSDTGEIRVVMIPKSISMGAMTQEEFGRFFDAAVKLWSEKLGVDVETLLHEAEVEGYFREERG